MVIPIGWSGCWNVGALWTFWYFRECLFGSRNQGFLISSAFLEIFSNSNLFNVGKFGLNINWFNLIFPFISLRAAISVISVVNVSSLYYLWCCRLLILWIQLRFLPILKRIDLSSIPIKPILKVQLRFSL